jgi:hypothetical protein
VLGRRAATLLQGGGTDTGALQQLEESARAGQEATADVLQYRKDGTAFCDQARVKLGPMKLAGLVSQQRLHAAPAHMLEQRHRAHPAANRGRLQLVVLACLLLQHTEAEVSIFPCIYL